MAEQLHYLIWSFEHVKWWRAASRGYTEDITQAGHYEEWEAAQIVRKANSHLEDGIFDEVMVPHYDSDKPKNGSEDDD